MAHVGFRVEGWFRVHRVHRVHRVYKVYRAL